MIGYIHDTHQCSILLSEPLLIYLNVVQSCFEILTEYVHKVFIGEAAKHFKMWFTQDPGSIVHYLSGHPIHFFLQTLLGLSTFNFICRTYHTPSKHGKDPVTQCRGLCGMAQTCRREATKGGMNCKPDKTSCLPMKGPNNNKQPRNPLSCYHRCPPPSW